MRLFKKFSRLSKKIPGFTSNRPYSLGFLNATQFLGAMNDNIFKLILVFMSIDVIGKQKASLILSATGAIFVIPFLLFSSAAGTLADRFSKQRLLMVMKAAEMVIIFTSLFVFATKNILFGYLLLLLLATHSALFGPSKYSIIPEIVPREKVSRANGLITACTYLAMIFGTFFASFLTEITRRNFVIAGSFCFFMSIIGFICSWGIKKTPSQDAKKRVHPFFLYEIYQTLRFCKKEKHLLGSISGSAYFLFIGSFTQLNIIPYAIESLGLSDIAGGYLFLSTAFGIAIGSFIAGKISQKTVELGLACLSGFAISLLLLILSIPRFNLPTVVTLLMFLGIFGGTFIVPFDTYTQLASPQEKRGQVIATANFLSFAGVLFASFALYFFSRVLELNASSSFAVLGILTLLISALMTMRLSDLSIPYLARKLFWRVTISGEGILDQHPTMCLVLIKPTVKKILILLSQFPHLQLLIFQTKKSRLHWLNPFLFSIRFLSLGKPWKEYSKADLRPCLCFNQVKYAPSSILVEVTLLQKPVIKFSKWEHDSTQKGQDLSESR